MKEPAPPLCPINKGPVQEDVKVQGDRGVGRAGEDEVLCEKVEEHEARMKAALRIVRIFAAISRHPCCWSLPRMTSSVASTPRKKVIRATTTAFSAVKPLSSRDQRRYRIRARAIRPTEKTRYVAYSQQKKRLFSTR